MKYHPLLLKESAGHYDTKGHSNIIAFETISTIGDGLGAINYNLIKYTNREKGQNDLDNKKIETFKAWRELLCDLLDKGYQRERNLRNVMQIEYPNLKYTFKDENAKSTTEEPRQDRKNEYRRCKAILRWLKKIFNRYITKRTHRSL